MEYILGHKIDGLKLKLGWIKKRANPPISLWVRLAQWGMQFL